MTPRIVVAAVQAAPVWLNRQATVDRACDLIAEAGTLGADLIGFPENFIPGHPNWYYYMPATVPRSLTLATRLFAESVEIDSDDVRALCRSARSAGVNVVMGLTERNPGTTGTLYNTQLFITSDGEVGGKHQKLVPTIGERLVHAPGLRETQGTFRAEFGRISALACGENSNPLAVAMVAADYPVVHVASWPSHFVPTGAGMPAASLLASRNIGYMAKAFVINASSVNAPDMIESCAVTEQDVAFMCDPATTGGSCVIDPYGQVIAGPMAGDQEGVLCAEIDLQDCVRGRLLHDFAGHYNRTDVFRLIVDNRQTALVTRWRDKPSDDGVDPAARADAGGRTGDERDDMGGSRPGGAQNEN